MLTVLAVMADLMFTVRILDIAKLQGIKTVFVKDGAALFSKLHPTPVAVIFDLNFEPADPIGLIGQMKGAPETAGIPLIGFVSHVQVDVKQRALEAGCDSVLARSAFAQSLPALLTLYAASETAARS